MNATRPSHSLSDTINFLSPKRYQSVRIRAKSEKSMMSGVDWRLTALEPRVGELDDVNALRRLHWAYGYFIDFNRPDEVAVLFSEDGVVVFMSGEYVGYAGVIRLY